MFPKTQFIQLQNDSFQNDSLKEMNIMVFLDIKCSL